MVVRCYLAMRSGTCVIARNAPYHGVFFIPSDIVHGISMFFDTWRSCSSINHRDEHASKLCFAFVLSNWRKPSVGKIGVVRVAFSIAFRRRLFPAVPHFRDLCYVSMGASRSTGASRERADTKPSPSQSIYQCMFRRRG